MRPFRALCVCVCVWGGGSFNRLLEEGLAIIIDIVQYMYACRGVPYFPSGGIFKNLTQTFAPNTYMYICMCRKLQIYRLFLSPGGWYHHPLCTHSIPHTVL